MMNVVSWSVYQQNYDSQLGPSEVLSEVKLRPLSWTQQQLSQLIKKHHTLVSYMEVTPSNQPKCENVPTGVMKSQHHCQLSPV